MKKTFSIGLGLWLATSNLALSIDSKSSPRPVPLTRPEMKQFLEDMKSRKPRIPLPELTAEDREKLGERATSYESRLRYHYLPTSDPRGGGGTGPARMAGGFAGRDNDPEMSLTYKFKVQLFWIVSRTTVSTVLGTRNPNFWRQEVQRTKLRHWTPTGPLLHPLSKRRLCSLASLLMSHITSVTRTSTNFANTLPICKSSK